MVRYAILHNQLIWNGLIKSIGPSLVPLNFLTSYIAIWVIKSPTIWTLNCMTMHIMSHDMTKPTKWLCAQQRLRSAWASAQSDQSLRCLYEESLGPKLSIECTAKTLIRLADAQADLSLRRAHTHFVGFVMRWLMSTTKWAEAKVFHFRIMSETELHQSDGVAQGKCWGWKVEIASI